MVRKQACEIVLSVIRLFRGGEDDELQLRVAKAQLNVDGPSKTLEGAIVDLEDMDLSTKLKVLRGSGECQIVACRSRRVS